MFNSWMFSIIAAGVCSAGSILLIREIPRFAGGMPTSLLVGCYMLLGGFVMLVVAAGQQAVESGPSIQLPSIGGMSGIAAIGLLLALLEMFFVFGAHQSMPMPDALIVYNVTSLGLLAFVSVVFMGESMSWSRWAGVALGIGSMMLLLQPAK